MADNITFPENWVAPRELTQALPRETRLTGGGIFLAVIVGILLVGSVALFLLFRHQNVVQTEHNEALRTKGRETSGKIVRLWHTGKSSTPMVTYSFTASGMTRSDDASVPGEFWNGLQTADSLPIRYLPADTSVNHPLAWEEPPLPLWLAFLLPGLYTGLALGLLIMLKRHAKVMAEGLPAAGVVVRCFRMKGGWMARYRFRTNEGLVTNGRDHTRQFLDTGAVVCVLYLPESPRRNQIYPGGLFKLAQ